MVEVALADKREGGKRKRFLACHYIPCLVTVCLFLELLSAFIRNNFLRQHEMPAEGQRDDEENNLARKGRGKEMKCGKVEERARDATRPQSIFLLLLSCPACSMSMKDQFRHLPAFAYRLVEEKTRVEASGSPERGGEGV